MAVVPHRRPTNDSRGIGQAALLGLQAICRPAYHYEIPHHCSVNLEYIARNANTCAGLGRFLGIHDLNFDKCADVFRVMAFVWLTWRESLRDIEVCSASNQGKHVSHGLQECPGSLDFGRCLEPVGLAYFSRACHAPDCQRQGALRQRTYHRAPRRASPVRVRTCA